MDDDHSARQRARKDILLRFHDLSWQDQYKTYKVIQAYFIHSGPGSKAWKELRERAECVEAVKQAAKHLGLSAGEAPRVQEYERARKELGLDLGAATIIRKWGVWREVCKAARGEKVSQSARQRANKRAALLDRPRSTEDLLAGVREWLLDGAHSPFSERDYDAWVQERNEQKPNVSRVAKGAAVSGALVLSWNAIVKVAKRDVSLVNAQRRQLKKLKKEGGGEFVSTRAIALILGVSESLARHATRAPTFPVLAFKVVKARVWYLADIEAHHAGEPVPKRKRGELQSEVLTNREIRALCSVTPGEMRHGIVAGLSRTPPPAGCIANHNYWFRVSVEAWLDARLPRAVTIPLGNNA
ncbi:MAG TPA: hypothetical protein VGO31_09070 [Microbacteriaceae bacterium]|jgi:hypothetical protein|nr:hypothetical protein [Microbacteriaceae bacterium]